MSPLDRTLALAEVHGPFVVGEHLNLDVAGGTQEALREHASVTEGALRFALRLPERSGHLLRVGDDVHALSAPSRRRLQEDGESDLSSREDGLARGSERVAARYDGDSGSHHTRPGPRLVAHDFDRLGGRSDMDESRGPDGASETGVLGQKTVPRMDRARPRCLRGREELVDRQVAFRGGRPSDPDRLVREQHVRGPTVHIGVDRDRLEAFLVAGADDPNRDLAAVRDQNLVEHPASEGITTGCCRASWAGCDRASRPWLRAPTRGARASREGRSRRR